VGKFFIGLALFLLLFGIVLGAMVMSPVTETGSFFPVSDAVTAPDPYWSDNCWLEVLEEIGQ
jgi:hypothetical protein